MRAHLVSVGARRLLVAAVGVESRCDLGPFRKAARKDAELFAERAEAGGRAVCHYRKQQATRCGCLVTRL